ncbi:Aromatic peroxygenase [Grifola frondosa]|uniref:Aromatic peroxygenase n=1 Tax=Grifola frondosa TaxID=5627 RepID=A0A1C7M0F2_GRIFR|nr:Aromatic peroxygenase [Grifola frondosa]
MVKVLKNDKRYLMFDHVPDQRDRWLREYLSQLSAPKAVLSIVRVAQKLVKSRSRAVRPAAPNVSAAWYIVMFVALRPADTLTPPTSPSTKDHAFSPPLPGDSRSPCPALNTLANHGFLPHDGRNMSVAQLVKAVEEGYNISAPFAWVLAAGGVMRCGKGGNWIFMTLLDTTSSSTMVLSFIIRIHRPDVPLRLLLSTNLFFNISSTLPRATTSPFTILWRSVRSEMSQFRHL